MRAPWEKDISNHGKSSFFQGFHVSFVVGVSQAGKRMDEEFETIITDPRDPGSPNLRMVSIKHI